MNTKIKGGARMDKKEKIKGRQLSKNVWQIETADMTQPEVQEEYRKINTELLIGIEKMAKEREEEFKEAFKRLRDFTIDY